MASLLDRYNLERYHRQELLSCIGIKGQNLLRKSKVAIIGIGALGTVVADLLSRAGIGTLLLIDRDIIEPHNLQRQHLFTEHDCFRPKTEQAALHCRSINSTIDIITSSEDLTNETIAMLRGYDLVLDCTDSMETRFLINDFCIKHSIPWIYAGAIATKGRILVIMPNGPCFRCVFSPPPPGSLDTCDTAGVLNTITTTIAALQCTEALKILTKQCHVKELLLFDIWLQDFSKIRVQKNKKCLCCVQKIFLFLNANEEHFTMKLCGQNRMQIKGRKPDIAVIVENLRKHGTVKQTSYGILFINKNVNFFLFNDGRCLIHASTPKQARTIYTKYIGA